MRHFNPLPPHGGRPAVTVRCMGTSPISIHSLRMEGDLPGACAFLPSISFQSTPSAWRETADCICLAFWHRHFNPLPPHGGRRHFYHSFLFFCIFQSTPSAWRETISCTSISSLSGSFQSTPSAWRETKLYCTILCIHTFQSTPSAWRETLHISTRVVVSSFQSTPSAWRETLLCATSGGNSLDFNPLPPHGGRQFI